MVLDDARIMTRTADTTTYHKRRRRCAVSTAAALAVLQGAPSLAANYTVDHQATGAHRDIRKPSKNTIHSQARTRTQQGIQQVMKLANTRPSTSIAKGRRHLVIP